MEIDWVKNGEKFSKKNWIKTGKKFKKMKQKNYNSGKIIETKITANNM